MNPAVVGYLIVIGFAVYWLRVGSAAVGGGEGTAILAIGSVILLGALWRVWTNRYRRSPRQRFQLGWFLLAVAGEVAALNLAVNLLPKAFLASYQAPVIGTIVGLHFIGLWAATRMPRFLWLCAGMTTLNLAAFALPPDGSPAILAGLGSAAALTIAMAA